jgi:hypothetical protein
MTEAQLQARDVRVVASLPKRACHQFSSDDTTIATVIKERYSACQNLALKVITWAQAIQKAIHSSGRKDPSSHPLCRVQSLS